MDSNELGITDLVAAVRRELEAVGVRAREGGSKPLFKLSYMELVVNFEVVKTTDASAGIDLRVLTVGGSTARSSKNWQQITLRYELSDAGKAGVIDGGRAHPLNTRHEEEVDKEDEIADF
ncbi:trypco2 family protein [Microbacterium sp. P5_E9]